jgi:iron(III) transport system permease protein
VLAVARAPWAVPGTALALVLLVGFSAEIRWVLFERVTLVLALGNTVWMLLVAYVLRFAAIPVGAVDAALSAVDPALEEAAAVAGAPPSVRATRVALPLVFADVLRGALLVSVAALSEVTLSVLLCGPSTRVVGTVAFDLLSYGDPAAAAALGLGLAAAGLLGVALAQSAARTAGAWS